MNLAHIAKNSDIYGPGSRFVIWVQGCSIRCKGCWNRDMWSFEQNNSVSVKELIEIIKSCNIDGVTILGGEPFDQYVELEILCRSLHDLDISVILYSGYRLQQLKDNHQEHIFSYIDALIHEPYIESARDTSSGIYGSSNQELLLLSNRYNYEDFLDSTTCEITIDNNGKVTFYGYPSKEIVEAAT